MMKKDRKIEEATRWFTRMRCDVPTDEDQHAFQTWLNHDPSHHVAYAEVKELWEEVGRIPDHRGLGKENPSLRHTFLLNRPKLHRKKHPAWVLAACLLLSTALGLWTFSSYHDLLADYVTEVGNIETVRLPDGSVVQLNTDTAIDVDFTDQRRRIKLFRGEAFFDVASNPNRPFEVEVEDIVSRAIGTSFNVSNTEQVVKVSVTEGVVRVFRTSSRSTSDMNDMTLEQGEEGHFHADGDRSRHQVHVEDRTSWRENKLVFTNQPLTSVVAELDRYRPGAILILDSELAAQRFTGVLHVNNIDLALTAIEKSLSLDVIRVTPYLTLLQEQDDNP